MKLEFSGQILEKCSNIKFHENPPIGSRVGPCGRANGRDLKVVFAFRNIANMPKNESCLKKATGIKNPPYKLSFV
jgi:hypothetical protein